MKTLDGNEIKIGDTILVPLDGEEAIYIGKDKNGKYKLEMNNEIICIESKVVLAIKNQDGLKEITEDIGYSI